MSDLENFQRSIKDCLARADQIFEAGYRLGRDLENLAEQASGLEIHLGSPANELDLSTFTAPVIARAVVALNDRRTALVRTLVNAALETRNGRRNGGCGGSPSVGNGHHHADAGQFELPV